MHRYRPAWAIRATLWVGLMATALEAGAHQHAHTHGQLELDAAIDGQTITLQIASPLDNLLGFERAPRTEAEKRQVADLVARLNAADLLLQPDPAAQCRLDTVRLQSAALGLGDPAGHGHDPEDEHGHADIDIKIVFSCDKADAARFVDVKLFEAFKGLRTIHAQVASPQGQFKRTLSARSPRLGWGR